jgi:hypothetical protein
VDVEVLVPGTDFDRLIGDLSGQFSSRGDNECSDVRPGDVPEDLTGNGSGMSLAVRSGLFSKLLQLGKTSVNSGDEKGLEIS